MDFSCINHITLVLTNDCNMRCDYCYCGIKYKKSIIMPVIEKVYALVKENDIRSLTFFGGEPLLELDIILKLHKAISEIKPALRFCLTTNGLLLTSKTYYMLLNKNFDITISIDGNQKRHDEHRKLLSGKGSWEAIMKTVYLLNPKPRIRFTFSPKFVCGLSNDVKKLYECGFFQLGFYPISGIEWSMENLEQYANEYQNIVNFCVSCFEKNMYIHLEPFNSIIYSHIYGNNEGCMAGIKNITISPIGDIFPCHRIDFTNKSLNIGNVLNAENDKKVRDSYNDWHLKYTQRDIDCIDCAFINRCKRCAIENLIMTGNISIISESSCEINKIHIQKTDEAAAYLFNVKNPLFLEEFYGSKTS